MFPQIYLLHYPSPPLYTTKSNHTSIYIYFWIARSQATAALRPQALQIILNTILNITLIQSYLVSQLISFHHTTTLHKPPPSSLRSSVRRHLQRQLGRLLQRSSFKVIVKCWVSELRGRGGDVCDVGARSRQRSDEDDVSERV
ncbi:Hypothetical_protein [Hexamita inflata]|uniref:Hypothetical_protein n=1 Tax=Hexamita inflata TaxID=28002 RepID=A0AA86PBZ6_9EUKA|nr:Hypothetical protein HINF_LOCUS23660 [Hexamita inflata]